MRQRLLHAAYPLIFVYIAFFVGETSYLAIHQIGMAILFALWLLWVWHSKRGWPTSPLDGPNWVLFGVWVISALLSRDPRVSLERVWNYFMILMLFYLLVDFMRQGRQRWLIGALLLLGATLVIFSVLELLAVYTGWPNAPATCNATQYGWQFIKQHELHALLLNPNALAAYCVLLIPVVFSWSVTVKQRDIRFVGLTLTVMLGLMLVFTRSRGGYLAGLAEICLGTLLVLSRQNMRETLPPALSRILRPRTLVVLILIGAIPLVAGTAYLTLSSAADNDGGRIALWISALKLFAERPIWGVGPAQYGPARLLHADVGDLHSVTHAHNAPLQILAEGGIMALLASGWLVVRLGQTWWRQHQQASGPTRLRLLGIGVALVGFSVHNLVDAFLALQVMALVLVLVAYVVYPKTPPAHDTVRLTRVQFVLPIISLLVFQALYVPIHLGAAAQNRARTLLDEHELRQALDAVRDAQRFDPELDLYNLQEAYVLGLLAYEQPDQYLQAAIEKHYEALKQNPAWNQGWHNLAALEAQNGNYAAAVEAEQEALDLFDAPNPYHFKLGEYYEQLGDMESARAAYFELLNLQPSLAASGFWDVPSHTWRAGVLESAIDRYVEEEPITALPIAMYAGEYTRAREIAENLSEDERSGILEQKLEAIWPTDGTTPCPICYFLPNSKALIQAERAFQTGELPRAAIEKTACEALLVDKTSWSYYIFARLDMFQHDDPDALNEQLHKAVPPVSTPAVKISLVFYNNRPAELDSLPQASTPTQDFFTLLPWLELLSRHVHEGNLYQAAVLYNELLQREPYLDISPYPAASSRSARSSRRWPIAFISS